LPHPKIFTIYRTWAAYVKGFFLSTEAMKYEVPCPSAPPIAASLILPAIFLGSNYVFYILTVCCITDMHINDIHISVILRGFSRGPSLFWSLGSKLCKYNVPRLSHHSLADPYGVDMIHIF
jgi:hypothetical protein